MKAAEAEKKEQEKINKAKVKNQQVQDIRRLTISNHQVELGTCRAVLSDPCTEASSDPPLPLVDSQTLELQASRARSAKGSTIAKKKNTSLAAANRLNQAKRLPRQDLASRLTTPPPIQMELI